MSQTIATSMFTPLASVKVVADNLDLALQDGHEFVAFDRQEVTDMLNHLRAAQAGMQVKEPDLSSLTEKQLAVYEYIRFCIEHGMPPTVREIQENFSFASPQGAECHLAAIESKGLIVREPDKARGIRLVR